MTLLDLINDMIKAYPTVDDVRVMLENRIMLEAGSPLGDSERVAESYVAHAAIMSIVADLEEGSSWIVPELRGLQARPTDYTYGDISALACRIADWFEGDHV